MPFESDLGGKPSSSLALVHWLLACSVFVALLTGFTTFDWTWKVAYPIREWLFAAHRMAGMIAGFFGLLWLSRYRFPQRTKRTGTKWSMGIRLFQFALLLVVLAMALSAWVARALGGRWLELVSFWPVFNLVSQPAVPLAYSLFYFHATLALPLATMVTIHGVGGIRTIYKGRS